jgi:bifunctional DNA-binding transcriptional regulator/antitoxin component of YhaV-PrlF toxin-antitoxin module
MSNTTSTITSKWQVTIPEDVRKDLPFKVGQRIAWEARDGKIVGRAIRPLGELAGSLKSPGAPPAAKVPAKAFAKAALARHQRLSRHNS